MENRRNLGILLSVVGIMLVVFRGVFDNDTISLIIVLLGAGLAVGGAVMVYRYRNE